MNATRTVLAVFGVLALMSGCGGSNPGGNAGGGAGAGGGGGGGGTGTGGGNHHSGTVLPADAKLGTYIVLGDAISDSGGTGPYFYEQLRDDLTAKFPGLKYIHAAQKDAVVDVYGDGQPKDAPLLKDQIAGLASDNPGDVFITITIGGGDLNAHSIAAITMTDAGVRGEFDKHLGEQLAILNTPGRLGTGKVYIVLGTIYDFTDGMGDFATVQCGPAANITPSVVQNAFGAWNTVIINNADKVGAGVYDMHADFQGHGYNNSNPAEVWFNAGDALSCLLPNAKGHDEIRREVYKLATGEAIP